MRCSSRRKGKKIGVLAEVEDLINALPPAKTSSGNPTISQLVDTKLTPTFNNIDQT